MDAWLEAKHEYIATDIGYRELAKKHGLSFHTLEKRARKEGWPALRRQAEEKVATAVATAATEERVSRALRIEHIADLLLEKIELTLEYVDGRKSNKAIKDLSDALKNAKDILNVRSEADMEEQAARIAKLRKDTEESRAAPEVVVSFKGEDVERWSQ